MINLSHTGRIFYGIAIAGLGILSIYYHDFPYMLIPSRHGWIPGLILVACISGILLILAGACIVFGKKINKVSLILGTALLLIFCFYFIPYEFFISTNFMHFGDWENAMKELALCGGAFVIAGCFSEHYNKRLDRYLQKLTAVGTIFFPATMIGFGLDHLLYAKQAADYVPPWIPYHLFWIYFAAIPLLGSGIAILLRVKVRLVATLLGIMIFIWFMILHIPYVIMSSPSGRAGEIASAILALAYSGIAFVIAGMAAHKGAANDNFLKTSFSDKM